jgi:hypothetical protein
MKNNAIQYTFFIIFRLILLRKKNISEQICRENQNTFYVQFFFENRVVYGIMLENFVDPGRPQIIWQMRIARWIPKATNRHSRNV